MSPKRSTPRKALLYFRISKDRANEASIAVQTEAAERYCEGRGWEIAGRYTDRGRSAYKGTPRPELDRLLEDAEAGIGNVIVVYKLDRLARSVRHFTTTFDQLAAHGCEFVSVTESFDTTTPMGRAMLQIAAVFAELESAVKGERLTDWHDHRKGLGAVPTGRPAFGYRSVKGKGWVIDRTQARHVRHAVERVLDGASLRSIVNEWNEAGVHTANGQQITQRGLSYILKSPHTAGLRDVGGVLVEGKWEPIITRAEHEKIAELLGDPARRTIASNSRRWLLAGIARCGMCGTPMKSKGHPRGTRYLCAPRPGYVGCGHVSINAAMTDETVIHDVLEVLDLKRVAAHATRQRGTVNEQIDALEAELLDLAKRRFAEGLRPQEWEILRAGIEAQIVAVQAEATSGKVGAAIRELANSADAYRTFCRFPIELQRSIILSVVDRVDIGAATRGASHFEPSRIMPDWKN